MKLGDRFEASPEVVARVLGDETMLLDLVSGTYFGLDAVGGRIWELLEEGVALTEVCDVHEGEFEVERPILEKDVLALAADLIDKKLIVPAD